MQPHHHRINGIPMHLVDYFNNCNFSKHIFLCSLLMV